MTDLAAYLISLGLVVVGALAFIGALRIEGRIRMTIACLAACVPVAAGLWLFHSSGLRVGDLERLLRTATQEFRQLGEGLRDAQQNRASLDQLLAPLQDSGRGDPRQDH